MNFPTAENPYWTIYVPRFVLPFLEHTGNVPSSEGGTMPSAQTVTEMRAALVNATQTISDLRATVSVLQKTVSDQSSETDTLTTVVAIEGIAIAAIVVLMVIRKR